MPVSKDFEKKWAEVVRKALSDQAFKAKLMKNPEPTLKEFGIAPPQGFKFQVHEEKNKVIHLYLPTVAEVEEVVGMDLKKVAGGISWDSGAAAGNTVKHGLQDFGNAIGGFFSSL